MFLRNKILTVTFRKIILIRIFIFFTREPSIQSIVHASIYFHMHLTSSEPILLSFVIFAISLQDLNQKTCSLNFPSLNWNSLDYHRTLVQK